MVDGRQAHHRRPGTLPFTQVTCLSKNPPRVLWLEEDLLGQFQEVAEAPPRSPSSELLVDLHAEGMMGSLPLCFSSLLDAEDLQNQLQGSLLLLALLVLALVMLLALLLRLLVLTLVLLLALCWLGWTVLNLRCLLLLLPQRTLLPAVTWLPTVGRVEELLVAEELCNDHKKLIFFPVCLLRPAQTTFLESS
ncbi:hypothetical protein Taro_000081 [Colocasia esculenta]|uniref:Uncharacterized protein n=1 Tax=Colocasia esculenta TaxID=4460 RepID=A0A843TC23_COLES|nr:hypothetical protein [Colocasia esculenta]